MLKAGDGRKSTQRKRYVLADSLFGCYSGRCDTLGDFFDVRVMTNTPSSVHNPRLYRAASAGSFLPNCNSFAITYDLQLSLIHI